jgi:hypothetical protein
MIQGLDLVLVQTALGLRPLVCDDGLEDETDAIEEYTETDAEDDRMGVDSESSPPAI